MATKAEVLRQLSIGSRVAEDEVEQLSRYFVETDQWPRILAGDVDIVFGSKGAGKSAIYTSLVSRDDELFDRRIVVVAGENPRGKPVFADIVPEPPTSEPEFVGLWKFYVLGLLDLELENWGIGGAGPRRVREELIAAGLAPAPGGLRGLVRRAREYVGRLFTPESIEPGIKLDAALGQVAERVRTRRQLDRHRIVIDPAAIARVITIRRWTSARVRWAG